MVDDLDVTEAILLDDTTALLYVGRRSTGEGLIEEETQAGIDHFSPYMEWRGMALGCNFQALALVEGQESMKAHEAQSQKSLRGREDLRFLNFLCCLVVNYPWGWRLPHTTLGKV